MIATRNLQGNFCKMKIISNFVKAKYSQKKQKYANNKFKNGR